MKSRDQIFVSRILSVACASVMILLPTSCSKDDGISDDTLSKYIEFSVNPLSVESRLSDTDPNMRNEFKTGDAFGVLGYCVPYDINGNDFDYTSASSPWAAKKNNAVPDVFFKQKVTLHSDGIWKYNFSDNNSTSYNPKYWYRDGYNTVDGRVDEIQHTDTYKYTFFAYYPYNDNVFSWIKPTGVNDKGAAKVKVTVPQNGTDLNSVLDITATPDAMLSVIYNLEHKLNSKVSFEFRHIFTALGFVVNNFSDRDLTVYSIKMQGTFWESLEVDFANGLYTYNEGDTYSGTYTIFDGGAQGLYLPSPSGEQTVTTSPDPIGGNYLRLLPGGFKGDNYLGTDVKLYIDYKFGNDERKTEKLTRPGTFLPQSGTQYTAQLNYVGNAFVLQFVLNNGESWEDGGSDGSEGDIVFE